MEVIFSQKSDTTAMFSFVESACDGSAFAKPVDDIVPDRINLFVYPFDVGSAYAIQQMYAISYSDLALFNRMAHEDLDAFLEENRSFDIKMFIRPNAYIELGCKVYIGDKYESAICE